MKQNRFRHLVALILMMCCTLGYAQTFKFQGLTYKVIDASKRYVEVYSGADTKTVKIPSTVTRGGVKYTVTSIGEEAFSDCSSLSSINIPSSVKSIGESAFACCESLTSINIPSSVKSIGDCAFARCESLTSINIPSSVKSIGYCAFNWCSLTSINIPSSVTSIENGAFSGCDNLTKLKVSPDNPVYDSRDNCNAIIETKSNTLVQGCKSTIIPNSVTSIGEWAFAVFYCLTSINIPSSVKSIGEGAFSSCHGLTSINIPNSVKSIGEDAFAYCESLTTITLPKHITNIDELGIPSQVRIIRKDKDDHSLGNNASYKKEEEEVLDNAVVEIGATYPGGEAAILSHIAKNMRYPEIAIEREIQGVVIIRFKVEKDGSVSTVTVAKALSRECDSEAVRIVKTLQRFTPARHQGKPVAVWYTLPVRFQIP